MRQYPLVISYATVHRGEADEDNYEEELKELTRSVKNHGLEIYSEIIDPTDEGWIGNCRMKGNFVLKCMEMFRRPLLWLDADARLISAPVLFDNPDFDFAVRFNYTNIWSGTIYLSPALATVKLVKNWAELCDTTPGVWDQKLLTRAYNETAEEDRPITHHLPHGYCHIEGRPVRSDSPLVIFQGQASRRLKYKV
jgi:hypothetical protein